MANTSFLPVREAELVTWSNAFSSKISATPVAYGLTAEQATAYATLNAAFVAAYNIANSDATNSRSATLVKQAAKKAMIANARMLAGIVQKFPGITNAQRADLGLTVPAKPSPVPAPTDRPGVGLVSVAGRVVSIDIRDTASSTKRGKPYGAIAAWVYSYVGTDYPTDPSEWDFQGATTKSGFDITFADDVENGAQVWICAAWINAKQEAGPISLPLTTNVQGGGISRAQKTNTQGVKLAA